MSESSDGVTWFGPGAYDVEYTTGEEIAPGVLAVFTRTVIAEDADGALRIARDEDDREREQ